MLPQPFDLPGSLLGRAGIIDDGVGATPFLIRAQLRLFTGQHLLLAPAPLVPTGGVEGAAAPVDEGGRYVDATGKPVPTSVARGEEFKRLPAYLRLFMDQREIPALLGELAAAPLPVEVRQFRLNPGGTSGGGGAAASRPPLGGEHNPAFGATGGGVWKTEDAGHSWRNVSDGYFKTGSVGALAVAPSDPNVIYVGMGEACLRSNFSHGDGVYRSTDAGETWVHLGLTDTRQIGKIRVHPKDPDWVYVAAVGHATGPNEERGLFRTVDGGRTWKKVLYVDPDTGCSDV